MKTQLKLILTAIPALFGLLFALLAPAARRGGDNGGKVSGFNFLPALFVVCVFAILTACGGGGSGGSSAATPQTYNLVWGPTISVVSTLVVPAQFSSGSSIQLGGDGGTTPEAVTRRSFLVDANGMTVASLATMTVHSFYRPIIAASAAVSINMTLRNPSSYPLSVIMSPTLHSFVVSASMAQEYGVPAGSIVRETVYLADFGSEQCLPIGFESNIAIPGEGPVRIMIGCLRFGGEPRKALFKLTSDVLRICVRYDDDVRCEGFAREVGGEISRPVSIIFLAFPDQTYRRDDGKCASAPFYAVGNCQSENAVDVGNFAAFVSGLDGGGYRQFGVRHRWNGEDWKAAAMVSHAKGSEFLDTWWGRLRLEHSIFDDATAFAEYESGITSLRQNGFMFADIPISGGRVGFRLDDFTASFGRPMHYKGKGNNAAAVHWQATKQTGLSFRTHNNNAEVQWQWRREF